MILYAAYPSPQLSLRTAGDVHYITVDMEVNEDKMCSAGKRKENSELDYPEE